MTASAGETGTTGRTRWTIVLLGMFAGIMVAFQIGKLPAAIPTLQRELGLDLVEAGWVLAVFHALAAAIGAIAGVYADRWGIRRVAFAGLLATGLGAAAGGLSDGLALLLLSRMVEGVGSITVLVSAPALMLRASRPGDQGLAMGMWGSFMPTGMAVMTLLTPLLLALAGWRGLWLVNAGLVWLFAGLFWAATRGAPDPAGPGGAGPGPWRELTVVLRRTGPWLLTLVMGLYAATYLPILGFLPKYLIEHHGYSQSAAAAWVALAIWANAAGNLTGGWLGHRGAPRWLLMIVALTTMGVAGWLTYQPGFSGEARLVFAFVFSGVGGLLPSSIFGSVTRHAPDRNRVAGINGLIQQSTNVGQLATPPLFAMLVAAGGWPQGPWLIVGLAAAAIVFALLLRRLERRGRVVQSKRSFLLQKNLTTAKPLDSGRDAAVPPVRKTDVAQGGIDPTAAATPLQSPQFNEFVRKPSRRTGPVDWPIAVLPPAVLAALGARTPTVTLSRQTAAKQASRHSDVRPEDYAVVQLILDRGELFRASERHVVGFVQWDGRMWRAVIKTTADRAETFLASLHKAKDRDFGAARRRLTRFDRDA